MTETTWDGLPITPEWPMGATIVIRRTDGTVLLLHRAANGVDFEGDWAWTSPAGARQPGEAMLVATARELYEEAGLSGIELTPVDLTGSWGLFTAEVAADAAVTLHDHEHDRYEWVRPSDAYERVRPLVVCSGIRRSLATSLAPITFRPLCRADLPSLVTWQNADHVRRWWDDAMADVDEAEKKYGPRIDGTAPTAVDIILLDGAAVGFIQTTPLAADPDYLETAGFATAGGADAVAIDYAIGASEAVGGGTGTRVIWSYIRDVVLSRFPGTRYVVADPPSRHTASVRACEKAGFRRVLDFYPEPESTSRHALCVWDRARVVGL
ncbi:MAG TPA: GNAT family N-acetyltransferase [Micromonosporaceae bacterium]